MNFHDYMNLGIFKAIAEFKAKKSPEGDFYIGYLK